jgi:hypothetical protein
MPDLLVLHMVKDRYQYSVKLTGHSTVSDSMYAFFLVKLGDNKDLF